MLRLCVMFAVVAGALSLAASPADATLLTWTFGSATLEFYDTTLSEPDWVPFDVTPTVSASQFDGGLKLFGTGLDSQAFSLPAAEYIAAPPWSFDGEVQARLLLSGTGTINGAAWQDPDDTIVTAFDFGFDFDSGQLDLNDVSTGFLLLDAEQSPLVGVGSSTGLGLHDPGSYGYGFQFVDRFNSGYETAATFIWQVRLDFEWIDPSPSSSLTFTIPQNSIDLSHVSVPEPASAALLLAGGLLTVGRRPAARLPGQ